jgi:hypothetical protein
MSGAGTPVVLPACLPPWRLIRPSSTACSSTLCVSGRHMEVGGWVGGSACMRVTACDMSMLPPCVLARMVACRDVAEMPLLSVSIALRVAACHPLHKLLFLLLQHPLGTCVGHLCMLLCITTHFCLCTGGFALRSALPPGVWPVPQAAAVL